MESENKKALRCNEKPVEDKLKDIFKKIGREATARELVRCYTGAEDKEQLPLPKPCEEVASEQIDTYCDGSVNKTHMILLENRGDRVMVADQKWQAENVQ